MYFILSFCSIILFIKYDPFGSKENVGKFEMGNCRDGPCLYYRLPLAYIELHIFKFNDV